MNISKTTILKRISALILAFLMLIPLSGCSEIGRIKDKLLGSNEPITQRPTVRLVFPEGSTVAEIAEILESGSVCTADEFLLTAQDSSLLSEYGFSIESPENRSFALEGYLFPDTYDFYVGEGSASAAKRFLKNARSKFDGSLLEKCAEIGMTLDEVLTLASIIQEEAGDPADMGGVSSVLHNRLDSSSFPKLQCDAATFYLRDSVKPYVTEERYEFLSQLYGTYICEGLPEGPITNPGIEAINAALNPDETDYYYFITDSDDVYHYAKTYSQHLKNCREAGLID